MRMSSGIGTRSLAAALAFLALVLAAGASAANDGEATWTGQWHTFWRDGLALMRLEQDGRRVTGTYRPGPGRIDGLVDGRLLTGVWEQEGASGGFSFVLSRDGKSFAGRFDNSEYWNGQRVETGNFRPTPFHSTGTPRDALRTIIVAANAAIGGNSGAALVYEPLLIYDGGETTTDERDRRRLDFYRLLEMTTFRLANVTDAPEGDSVLHEIGPAGSDFSFTIEMRRDEQGSWRLVVPSQEWIAGTTNALLDDLDLESYAAYRKARRDSPRAVMRAFLSGVADWGTGGRDRALAVMDLSHIPPALRSINGPLAADYLVQIIDRVGYVVWQEIPDDPARLEPYVHYAHAAGAVTIAQGPDEAEPRWRFTADTIADAPAIFEAVEDLPLAPGLAPPEPFSEFFALREWVSDLSPRLLERSFLLSHWQWIAIALSLLVSVFLAFLAGLFVRLVWHLLPATVRGEDPHSAGHERALILALRIMIVGAVLYFAFGAIGLRSDVLAVLATTAVLVTLAGFVALRYTRAGIVGGAFRAHAETTPTTVDVIVSSLTTAVVRILIVVGGVIFAADLVGIPYEGVVAGLGVGGLALAIAARDTVSNFFGAAVLMADRPFKRGDYIEIDGRAAVVEEVGLRSSRMRLFDDALMIIPNAKVADNTVLNYGRRRKRRILLTVALKYGTPRKRIDAFVARIRELLRTFPRADSEYYVGLARFAESAVEIDLWCYVWVASYTDHVDAQHRLIGDIVALADEVGVDFALPARSVYVSRSEERRLAAEEEPLPDAAE